MTTLVKSELKSALLASLDAEIDAALTSAQDAQATASHEQNKPENQYDTLALEAAYLAHGQSERIRELQQLRIRIGQWTVPAYEEDDLAGNGALIQLQRMDKGNPGERWIWIAPVGGRQLMVDNTPVQVVSLQAPLAQQLVRLGEGDELLSGTERWEIMQLS